MLNKAIVIWFYLLSFLIVQQVFSQTTFWKQTQGPRGQQITSSAAGIHNDLYIVAHSTNSDHDPRRIWHTNNDGKDWEDVSGTLPTQVLSDIVCLSNGDLYAGERWDGTISGPVYYPRTLYRLRSGTQKWDTIKQEFYFDIMNVAPDGVFYLSGNVNGADNFLYRSLDSGRTWRNIQDSRMKYATYDIHYFSFDNIGNVFVNVQKALYKSGDSGTTWKKLPTLDIFEVPIQKLNDGSLVTYGSYNSFSGLWKSTDDGGNWDPFAGNILPDFIILPGDRICAVNQKSLIFSSDLGKSWRPITPVVPGWKFISDRKGGFYYSSSAMDTIIHGDNDGNILSVFPSPSGTNVSAILIDDFGKMVISGPSSWTKPAISIDHGSSWNTWHQSSDANCYDIWRYGKDSSGGLLAAKGGALSRSVDSGNTWKEIRHAVATSSSDIRFTTSPIGGIYTASPQTGILRSTDLGTTWVQIDEFGINVIQMVETAPDGSTIVCADNNIYRSRDLYTTWFNTARLKDTNFHLNPNLFLRASSIKSAGAADVIVGTDGDGAIRSTDNGITWNAIRTGAENAKIYEMVESKNGDIYALAYTSSIRVLYLPYHGSQWFDVSFGLGNTGEITSLAADKNGTVLVGTLNSGVYKLVNEVNKVFTSHTSDKITLSISPNPASSNATLTYSLPDREIVKLDLYDALGRRLLTFVNQIQDAGEHSVNAELPNLANGIYFVKLSTAIGSVTEKIIIAK